MTRLRSVEPGDVDSLPEAAREIHPETPQAFALPARQGRALSDRVLAVSRQPNQRTLPVKPAALHHQLSRNHSFEGGNRRLAVTATELFPLREGAILENSADMLKRVGLDVAGSAMTRAERMECVGTRTMREGCGDDQFQ